MNTGGINVNEFREMEAVAGGVKESAGTKDSTFWKFGDQRGLVGHDVKGIADHENES